MCVRNHLQTIKYILSLTQQFSHKSCFLCTLYLRRHVSATAIFRPTYKNTQELHKIAHSMQVNHINVYRLIVPCVIKHHFMLYSLSEGQPSLHPAKYSGS
jgi:hypothetical protein